MKNADKLRLLGFEHDAPDRDRLRLVAYVEVLIDGKDYRMADSAQLRGLLLAKLKLAEAEFLALIEAKQSEILSMP